MSRLLISLILSSFLIGCASKPEPRIVTEHIPVYIDIVCPDPNAPNPISTRPVRPKAIQDRAGIWWVGLEPEDYQNLAINTKETIRYIKDQKAQIRYYQQCVSDFNSELEKKRGEDDDVETGHDDEED